jgi:hypothetical protein
MDVSLERERKRWCDSEVKRREEKGREGKGREDTIIQSPLPQS